MTRFVFGAFLVLVISVSAQAEGLLTMKSAIGPAGGVGTVKVFLKDAKDTGSLDIRVSFPTEALTFLKVEPGEVADNAMAKGNETSPGHVMIALVDQDGFSGDGAVVALSFKIKADVGQTIPIRIVSATANHFEKLIEIHLTVKDGQLKVVAPGFTMPPRRIQILVAALAVITGIIFLLLLRARRVSKKQRAAREAND